MKSNCGKNISKKKPGKKEKKRKKKKKRSTPRTKSLKTKQIGIKVEQQNHRKLQEVTQNNRKKLKTQNTTAAMEGDFSGHCTTRGTHTLAL
jgi:hypothetical protein